MQRMPVLFVGHGSPMNAIEDNTFTRQWELLGNNLPRPKAILAVSAHWFTAGTRVSDDPSPRTVYDMYGFPEALYRVEYRPAGSPDLAGRMIDLIRRHVTVDNSWGIDHGTWSVLKRIFPKADVPVVQLSVDQGASPADHFRIGQELQTLRNEGILILGSGNVVHNLSMVQWSLDSGYPWAETFDHEIRDRILRGDLDGVLQYQKIADAKLAVPYPDHFSPLLYVLGACTPEDHPTVLNDACILGSLSMTSYLLG